MRKLCLILSLLFTICTNASLLGEISGKNAFLSFDIMDFQRKNHVGFEVSIDKADVEQKYTHTFFYVPVYIYLDMTNTEKSVSGTFDNIDYQASGPLNNRKIELEERVYDDAGEVAQKNTITIKLIKNRANIKIDAYRRKQILFYVGDLKRVSSVKVNGVSFERNGVCLYGDNRGWPIGKVESIDALNEASFDTRLQNLEEVSEGQCDY